MASGVYEDTAPAALRAFTERCRVLGLPSWTIGSQGIIESPSGWGPADHWLRAPLMGQWINRAASGWMDSTPPDLHELFAGCWLIPIGRRTADGDHAMTVCMALGSEVLRADHMHAVCDSGRLDAMLARTALSPLARYERSTVDRLGAVLRWMHEDLIQVHSDRMTIRSFSFELANAYEQVSLLFRLGQSINRLHEPEEFIEMACSMLYDTLDFQWVTAVFMPLALNGSLIRQEFFVAGGLPCQRGRFQSSAVSVFRLLRTEAPTLILPRGSNELTELVRSEVIADPVFVGDRLVGMVIAGNKTVKGDEVSSTDTQLVKATAEYIGSFLHSAGAYHEQRAMFLGTVRAITTIIEAKDRYTRGHSDRVAHLAARLAEMSGQDELEIRRVRLAGLLHDVGKIGIAESVLTKPGRLTEREFEAIKRHPVIGYTILKDIEPLQDILPGVLYHHERWDGTGYPAGLRGDRIPMVARLLAVADMFDAMSSDRSYRKAIDRKNVLLEVERRGGTQLDPELARLFLTLDLSEYDQMIRRHRRKR